MYTRFAIVDENHSLASIISFVNPDSHGDRLRDASDLGFMVRTRPDEATNEAREVNYTRFEKALDTGANFITTDFPGNDLEIEYSIWLPEGPVMCNARTAPTYIYAASAANVSHTHHIVRIVCTIHVVGNVHIAHTAHADHCIHIGNVAQRICNLR